MHQRHLAQLEKLGLSTADAQIYLALERNAAPMTASTIVNATGVPRSSVYPALTRLADRGLIEAEAGYGGRFSAVPAERALPSLMLREKEELKQREEIASALAAELTAVTERAAFNGDAELIQVLRDPRVIADRFERLQLEAERLIEVFCKAPFFVPPGNEVEDTVLRRGVRVRSLYERAVLGSADIKPHLKNWIAKGEEARIHNGELPHKLAIFDRQNILLPLLTPAGQVRTLFIRHPQLATSLGMLFDFLWERAELIATIQGDNGSFERVAASGNRVSTVKTQRNNKQSRQSSN